MHKWYMKRLVLLMDSFGAQSLLKRGYYLPSTASSPSIILGKLRVTGLRPIFEDLELSSSFLLQRILQSYFSHVIFKGVIDKQPSTSSQVTNAKLQIHVRLSSEFLAFTIFDWSPKSGCLTGCLFKEEGQFQVDWNCYFFIASVLLLNYSSICLHTNNGCESKNKGFRV